MSFGSQSSDQQQQSQTGLLPEHRTYFSGLTPGLFSNVSQAARLGLEDPAGLDFTTQVDRLLPRGRYGVAPDAEMGVRQLGRDLFSQASAARALRGGYNPEHLESVLGDSIMAMSANIVPLQTQYAMARAQLAPQLRQAAFGFAVTPFQLASNILSQAVESAGTGHSSGIGFGV